MNQYQESGISPEPKPRPFLFLAFSFNLWMLSEDEKLNKSKSLHTVTSFSALPEFENLKAKNKMVASQLLHLYYLNPGWTLYS